MVEFSSLLKNFLHTFRLLRFENERPNTISSNFKRNNLHISGISIWKNPSDFEITNKYTTHPSFLPLFYKEQCKYQECHCHIRELKMTRGSKMGKVEKPPLWISLMGVRLQLGRPSRLSNFPLPVHLFDLPISGITSMRFLDVCVCVCLCVRDMSNLRAPILWKCGHLKEKKKILYPGVMVSSLFSSEK